MSWKSKIRNKLLSRLAPGTARTLDVKLSEIIAAENIDLVIDVGANEGQFASALRTHYSGDIISFEPASAPYSKLKDRSLADPRWSVHQLALGSEESIQELNVAQSSLFNSFLKSNTFSSNVFDGDPDSTQTERARVISGSQYLRDHGLDGRRIFLKMDTQGFDLQVFFGFKDCLTQINALIGEVSVQPIYDRMPHWLEAIAIYERAGFSVSYLEPVTTHNGMVVEFDCVMRRL